MKQIFAKAVKTLGKALFWTILVFVGAFTLVEFHKPGSSEPAPVKKSRSGICHCPEGRYYEQTANFKAFSTIEKCLESGGRQPRRGQGDCTKATPTPGSPEDMKRRLGQGDDSQTIKRRDFASTTRVPAEPPLHCITPDPLYPKQALQVIDGDTIRLAGRTIRLKGIDAPELDQNCRDRNGEIQPCGDFARLLLMQALSPYPRVECEIDKQKDRYGRDLGVCYVFEPIDINAWMVSEGLALAYRQYSEFYVLEEDEARAERRGIHQGEFVPPWDWRRGKRLEISK